MGPYLVEKFLSNNKYIVRKLNTNKTQLLHRIRLRKYNPEKPPGDNYQEAQWQIDDNIVIPQDDLYTNAWEVEFGGHLLHIPIIYIDPSAIDFDESYTQGPDTVIVQRSFFMIQAMIKIGKLAPVLSHLYCVLQIFNRMVKFQTLIPLQTHLHCNEGSKQTSESCTDTEIICDPMPPPPIRQSDTPSMLEINDPTTENIPQNESGLYRGRKYNLRPNPNTNYSEIYKY